MKKIVQARIPAQLTEAIRAAKEILLVCHVSPDGDTVGSALALKMALKKIGKNVTVACEEKVPDTLLFLDGAESILMPQKLAGTFDLAIAVDVSDIQRMGTVVDAFQAAKMTAQVDHHGTNPGYAKINAIDGDACATGILVYELIKALDVQLDMQLARCLYTAISTDTGNFSFDNTSAEAFQIMAELMRYPINLYAMNRILFKLRSRAQTKLLACALKSLTFYADDTVAGMTLSKADFDECGARAEHAEAIVNYGIDTIGVQIAFLAREQDSGDIKFSLRALPPANVAKVAMQLGGGGHVLAAGCTVPGPMENAVSTVIKLIEAHLEAIDE